MTQLFIVGGEVGTRRGQPQKDHVGIFRGRAQDLVEGLSVRNQHVRDGRVSFPFDNCFRGRRRRGWDVREVNVDGRLADGNAFHDGLDDRRFQWLHSLNALQAQSNQASAEYYRVFESLREVSARLDGLSGDDAKAAEFAAEVLSSDGGDLDNEMRNIRGALRVFDQEVRRRGGGGLRVSEGSLGRASVRQPGGCRGPRLWAQRRPAR